MKLLTLVLLVWTSLLAYHAIAAAKENAVACRIVSIDESVIQQLKKRVAPF